MVTEDHTLALHICADRLAVEVENIAVLLQEVDRRIGYLRSNMASFVDVKSGDA